MSLTFRGTFPEKAIKRKLSSPRSPIARSAVRAGGAELIQFVKVESPRSGRTMKQISASRKRIHTTKSGRTKMVRKVPEMWKTVGQKERIVDGVLTARVGTNVGIKQPKQTYNAAWHTLGTKVRRTKTGKNRGRITGGNNFHARARAKGGAAAARALMNKFRERFQSLGVSIDG